MDFRKFRGQGGLYLASFVATAVASLALDSSLAFSEDANPTVESSSKNALDDLKAEMEIGRNMAGRLLAFMVSFKINNSVLT